MTEQFMGSDQLHNEHERLLSAMQIQLRSQRASDILRGMMQVKKWLQENPEDRQVYEILLDAVQENHEIREKVRDLFLEMMQKGSKGAEEALSILPSTPRDLLADADDAYYAAEYGRAIQLYLQVLKRVPDHERAMEYLAKAKTAQQDSGEIMQGLPREAVQYYRRARSYLAAKDFLLAIKSLSAAVETAQSRGMEYPDADELLKTAQDSLIADEYKQKANLAIEEGKWEDALGFIKKGLALNLADIAIKKELGSLDELLRAELDLRKYGALKVFVHLGQIRSSQKKAERVVNPGNPLLKLVSKEINRIRSIQFTGIFILLLGISFLIYKLEGWESNSLQPGLTDIPVLTISLDMSKTMAQPPVTLTATNTQTAIATINVTATETLTPTITSIPVLGYGKLTEYTYPLEKPNGDIMGLLLKPKQFVIILDRQEVNDSIWYRCRWDNNGNIDEGWLLEKYIQFAPPPTPTP